MGVTILQSYPIPPDKSPAQVVDLLQKRILNLGATLTSQFMTDCETYHSVPGLANPPKTLHIVHVSEFPASVFSVLESNGKVITFTSDTLLDLLLLKLTNLYSKKLRIESKGSRYKVGDFIVKVLNGGFVLHGPFLHFDTFSDWYRLGAEFF